MRSVERIVAPLPWCSSVCLGRACIVITVHVSADLSLWLSSPMFRGILTPKHIHLLPVVFFEFHLEERWGMDVETRRDISRTVQDSGRGSNYW